MLQSVGPPGACIAWAGGAPGLCVQWLQRGQLAPSAKNATMTAPQTKLQILGSRSQQFAAASLSAFHAYGAWLVKLSWRRFLLLSLLLVVASAMLQELPPFSWSFTETVVEHERSAPRRPKPPAKAVKPVLPDEPAEPQLPEAPEAPQSSREPGVHIQTGDPSASGSEGVDISIDQRGVRIRARPAAPPAAPASDAAASAPAAAASAAAQVAEPAASSFRVDVNGKPVVEISAGDKDVRITLPPGADSEAVREALEEARDAVVEAIHDAQQAEQDAAEALSGGPRVSVREVRYIDFLVQLALLWVAASAILKVTYKGRIQAEVKAAQATETAEAESLRRQVVEARMAAMQAQVEPHFLFNTLASIDHLIETDPARASQMQKNLIALLRASMPTMRETTDGGPRDLGRELALVRPYVEILKVRMEERLEASIDVPDGLLSAEFPSMMIQTLVENAIRHGLEPKPEGGSLRVRAEIVHGKLVVTVADTGVGFGNATTSGSGVGLANIRERLQLLYGDQASVTVMANQPSGTLITVTVPYRTVGPSRSA